MGCPLSRKAAPGRSLTGPVLSHKACLWVRKEGRVGESVVQAVPRSECTGCLATLPMVTSEKHLWGLEEPWRRASGPVPTGRQQSPT